MNPSPSTARRFRERRRHPVKVASLLYSICYRNYRHTARRRRRAARISSAASSTSNPQSRAPQPSQPSETMDTPSADQIKSWLEVVLDPRMNREPEEFYQEQVFIKQRKDSFPEYSTAAIQWWQNAEDHWTEVEPLVARLFSTKNSWNFVQWVLELVRQLCPEHYTLQASSYDAELDLIDSLCDGTTSPLHITSMLGLNKMSQYLFNKGANTNLAGYLGTPILCALAGPGVATLFQSPPSWKAPFISPFFASDWRMNIIGNLNSQTTTNYRHRWKRSLLPDLSGLAFTSSLATKRSDAFREILSCINSLVTLIDVFNAPTELLNFNPDRATLAELVTLVVDFSIAPPNLDMPIHRELRKAMSEFMVAAELSFERSEIAYIHDEDFGAIANEIIIEEEEILLERLVLDPRFHINMPSAMGEDDGTILHMAVSGDSLKAVDVFMRAGGNCDSRDGAGRTPLMVSETEAMLSLLVDKYKVSTTGTDNTGRNIWHYAVATNEMGMILWLSVNDPAMETNLSARTTNGMTPFDEALIYTLEYWPIGERSDFLSIKNSMMVILRWLMDRKAILSHSILGTPTAHLLACWGNAGIMDEMQRRGIDFLVLDKHKRSALHYVNSLSTADTIRRLQHLCGTVPVMDADKKTPAETVLLSSTFKDSNLDEPVCKSLRGYAWLARQKSFTLDMYRALLTPAVLSSRDDKDRGIWQRVCEDIIPVIKQPTSANSLNRDFNYGNSIGIAVNCIVRSRSARDYERETDNPAATTFFSGITTSNYEWLTRNQLHYDVVEQSDPELIHKFYQSPLAANFLVLAIHMADEDFVEFLIRQGIDLNVKVEHRFIGEITLFHLVISADARGTIVRAAIKSDPNLDKYPLHETLVALMQSNNSSNAIHKLGILIEHDLLKNYTDEDTKSKALLAGLYLDAIDDEHEKVKECLEGLGFS